MNNPSDVSQMVDYLLNAFSAAGGKFDTKRNLSTPLSAAIIFTAHICASTEYFARIENVSQNSDETAIKIFLQTFEMTLRDYFEAYQQNPEVALNAYKLAESEVKKGKH